MYRVAPLARGPLSTAARAVPAAAALASLFPPRPLAAPELTLTATHARETFLRSTPPNTTPHSGTLTLTVRNAGADATTGTVTVANPLPAGLAALINNPALGAGPIAGLRPRLDLQRPRPARAPTRSPPARATRRSRSPSTSPTARRRRVTNAPTVSGGGDPDGASATDDDRGHPRRLPERLAAQRDQPRARRRMLAAGPRLGGRPVREPGRVRRARARGGRPLRGRRRRRGDRRDAEPGRRDRQLVRQRHRLHVRRRPVLLPAADACGLPRARACPRRSSTSPCACRPTRRSTASRSPRATRSCCTATSTRG